MFCSKCGTQNDDFNNTCVNCGAPLKRAPRPNGQPVQDANVPGYTQQPAYYAAPVEVPRHGKPTALYIIAGVLGLINVLMVFTPQITDSTGKTYHVFQLIGELYGHLDGLSASEKQLYSTYSILFIALFFIPIALLIVWSLLSFLQKRPAGVIGIIGSVIYFFVLIFWIVLLGIASASPSLEAPTAFPIIMLLLNFVNLPISIVQLVKKKYL